MSVCCTSHWSCNSSARRIRLFTITTRDREELPSTQYHERGDASTLNHFRTAYIHSHFTEGVNYGWMLYQHDICLKQSGQISIIYFCAHCHTRVSPYPHVNLQNPVSILCSREGTVQAPYKKVYNLPVQHSAC